jgi:hypothetical protein
VLSHSDVLEASGQIKAETTLTPRQNQGKKGLKIWLAEKLRAKIDAYDATHRQQATQAFYTLMALHKNINAHYELNIKSASIEAEKIIQRKTN